MQIVDAVREMIAGYKLPGTNQPSHFHFKIGLNSVPDDVLTALRVKRNSAVEAALEGGFLRMDSVRVALQKQSGQVPFGHQTVAEAPLQAAAQTYAQTKNEDAAMNAAFATTLPPTLGPRGRNLKG